VEALFNEAARVGIDPTTVADLRRRVADAPRGRFRLCLHGGPEAPIHEMLIVLSRGSYIRPHRHPPGKVETYLILEGVLDLYFFDAVGRPDGRIPLSSFAAGGTFLYRTAEPVWHMPMAASADVVYYEVFTGPFRKDADVEYAPWSPAEEDERGARAFLERLVSGPVGAPAP